MGEFESDARALDVDEDLKSFLVKVATWIDEHEECEEHYEDEEDEEDD